MNEEFAVDIKYVNFRTKFDQSLNISFMIRGFDLSWWKEIWTELVSRFINWSNDHTPKIMWYTIDTMEG